MANIEVPMQLTELFGELEQFPDIRVPNHEHPLRWAVLPSVYMQYLLAELDSPVHQGILAIGGVTHYVLGDDENCFGLTMAPPDYFTAQIVEGCLLGILYRLHWESAILHKHAHSFTEAEELVATIDTTIPTIQIAHSHDVYLEAHRIWREMRDKVSALLQTHPQLAEFRTQFRARFSERNNDITKHIISK